MIDEEIEQTTDPVDVGVEPVLGHVRPAVRRILLSASATVILQGASMAMGFATAVLLARFLGVESYGRYILAFSWASILTIPAILGLDRFLVRGIAVYEVQQKWQLMRGLLRRTNQLVLLTSATIASLGCVVALLWLSPSLRWPFCVAMLLIPITALTLLRQGAMQAIGRVVTGQAPEYLIRPALILAGIGTLKLLGGHILTPTSALVANVAGVTVAFIVGALALRRALPDALRSAPASYATRDWLRASLPMMLIGGVWMLNSYLITLLVGTLDGARAAGVYSVAQKGAELIVMLLVAANMPLAPAIARMHEHGDRAGFQQITQRVAQATLLTSAPVAAAFILFPSVYLGIFGSGFQAGTSALIILALGQLANAAAGPAGNVLLMTGNERLAIRGMGVGLLVNLILGIALIPPLGVAGGAVAFAVSLVVWNVMLVVLARRRIGVNVTAFRVLAMPTGTQTG
jgi:O-antigen/teichoic acid export membrane protein